MSVENSSVTRKKSLFLLLPGFEEGTAVYCLGQMREVCLDVSIVGLSSTPVRGLHGIMIQPDLTLDEVSRSELHALLFISGGHQYLSALLVDPRFYHLYQRTLTADGLLASIGRATPFLMQSGIIDERYQSRHIARGQMPVDLFASRLINAVEAQQTANAPIGQEDVVAS